MPYNWTGFYIGGQGGGGWASSQTTAVTGIAFPPGFVENPINGSGVFGGVYAGYNYQINQIVIGIEEDYSWANLVGPTATMAGPTGFTMTKSNSVNWILTLTGRLGYAVNDWMVFGKAGWAWAGFSSNGIILNPSGVTAAHLTASDTRNGWTIGTGVEWGFATHWSAKLEYDYAKFNIASYNDFSTAIPSGVVTPFGRSATSSLNMIKLGVAYRFADDLPTKAPVYNASTSAIYNWTGFYVGGHVGGGWQNNATTVVDGNQSFPAGFVFTTHLSGVLGGVYAGYNYQINQIVIGIEEDYSFANVTGTSTTTGVIGPPGVKNTTNSKINGIGTLAARFGYAANHWLFFGKLGGAWEHFASDGVTNNPGGLTLNSHAETRSGGLVGIGIEWGFMPNWSAKMEYDYAKFGTANINQTNTNIATGAVSVSPRSAAANISMLKIRAGPGNLHRTISGVSA